jgi:hypothetical protein
VKSCGLYNLAAVLDLNGDGKLEVIVHSFYYEGGRTTIYRCEPDKIEPELSVECGALDKEPRLPSPEHFRGCPSRHSLWRQIRWAKLRVLFY